MNRIIVACVMILLVISVSSCAVISLNRSCDALAKTLDEIKNSAVSNDTEKAENLTESVIPLWEKHEKIISLLVDHREIDEIEETIKSLPVYIRQDDMERLEEKSSTAAERVRHIKDKEKIAIENVL